MAIQHDLAISLFEILAIMLLTSRKKSFVSGVNCATHNTLDVLKKPSTFRKMTEVIYFEVLEKPEAVKKAGRRAFISGML